MRKAGDAAGVPATIGFALAEPRREGDDLTARRAFLLQHLKATPARAE